MEIMDAIATRRSIRSFQEKEVEQDKLDKILNAATQAPSAGNTQPWEFIVIKEQEQKKKIALKVGKITGLDVFAVDIIKGKDGKYYVIDVNTFPGLYPEMYEQAELNLFDELIACIRSKLK